jgi:hypothetical protein
MQTENRVKRSLIVCLKVAHYFSKLNMKLIDKQTSFVVNQVQRGALKIPTIEEPFGMLSQGGGIEATRVQLILLVG